MSIQPAAGTSHGTGDRLAEVWAEAHERPIEGCAVVSRLFVSVPRQGRGLARDLLGAAVEWMHERDLAPCVDVFPLGNPWLVPFYERAGWVRVAELSPVWRRPTWPPLVALVLPRHVADASGRGEVASESRSSTSTIR